jgi:hypothetical protein
MDKVAFPYRSSSHLALLHVDVDCRVGLLSHGDVEDLIRILADTPSEAMSYVDTLLKKHGVNAQ